MISRSLIQMRKNTHGDFKKWVFIEEEAAQQSKIFSTVRVRG